MICVCLQASVLKALKRLEDVQEMFEKRHISLKRLSAKQTRPVQHVAPRPESSPKQPSVKNSQRTAGSQPRECEMSRFAVSSRSCVTVLSSVSCRLSASFQLWLVERLITVASSPLKWTPTERRLHAKPKQASRSSMSSSTGTVQWCSEEAPLVPA